MRHLHRTEDILFNIDDVLSGGETLRNLCFHGYKTTYVVFCLFVSFINFTRKKKADEGTTVYSSYNIMITGSSAT